jgi:hypothetical protein
VFTAAASRKLEEKRGGKEQAMKNLIMNKPAGLPIATVLLVGLLAPTTLLAGPGGTPETEKYAWDVKYQGGTEPLTLGLALRVTVGSKRIVAGMRDGAVVFLIPAGAVTHLIHESETYRLSTPVMEQAGAVAEACSEACDAFTAVSLPLTYVPAWVVAAPLAPFKTTKHIVTIKWRRDSEAGKVVLNLGGRDYATLLERLEQVTGLEVVTAAQAWERGRESEQWVMKHERGTEEFRPGAKIKVMIEPETLVVGREGRLPIAVPVSAITEVVYNNETQRRSEPFQAGLRTTFAQENLIALADTGLAGAAFIGVQALATGLSAALTHPFKTTRHFVEIYWEEEGELKELTFKVGKGEYAGFLAELERVTRKPWQNLPLQRQELRQALKREVKEQMAACEGQPVSCTHAGGTETVYPASVAAGLHVRAQIATPAYHTGASSQGNRLHFDTSSLSWNLRFCASRIPGKKTWNKTKAPRARHRLSIQCLWNDSTRSIRSYFAASG